MGGEMNNKQFKELLNQIEALSPLQKRTLLKVMEGKEVELSVAKLINEQNGAGVICAHCGDCRIKRWGFDGEIQRYRCLTCRRTFNALSGTPLAKLRARDKWLAYAQTMEQGLSIRKAAQQLDIDPGTSFRWRHRFLRAPSAQTNTELTGIVEADETYFPDSKKGQRKLTRAPRRRGGSAKKKGVVVKQVAVLVALDRQGQQYEAVIPSADKQTYAQLLPQLLTDEAILCTDGSGAFKEAAKMTQILHHGLNTKEGIRVKQKVFHIQHVNAFHSDLKTWIRCFRGVSTKYLSNYLAWHRFQYPTCLEPTPEQRLRRSLGFGNV
jgi:transposase-like protein